MKFLKKTLLATGLAALCAAPALAADRALLIGVGKFANSQYDLPGIELDTNMARELVLHMGIAESNITLLMDGKATVRGIAQAMEAMAKQVGPDDRVVIYVSSHGSQLEDKNGDEEDGLDETLFVHDGHLVDDDFGRLIQALPSKNVLVLIDACHSGTVTKSWSSGGNQFGVTQGVPKFIPPKTRPKPGARANSKAFGVEGAEGGAAAAGGDNNLLISAAQENQLSVATGRGSLFTLALLDSFESKRGSGGEFTWKQVYEETKSKLASTGVDFSPNLMGNAAIAAKPIRIAGASNDRTADSKPVWREFEGVAAQGNPFTLKAPSVLTEGDKLVLEMEMPIDGYLNLVSVDADDNATLLYPNKYDQDNHLKPGAFQFPGGSSRFVIRAQAPLGNTLVVALVTPEPLSLLKEGRGNRDKSGNITGLFARLQSSDLIAAGKSTRAFKAEAKFHTAKAVVKVNGR